jgi:hypothetical protein
MASITNVINVQILTGGRLAARDNLNVVSLITSELGFLSTNKRYEVYRDLASVANDFGTTSKAYDHAKAFFGTSPNPINAGGYLVIGYWRAVSETVAASAATLKGAELSGAAVIGQLQAISDGSMAITVDGVADALTGLDFRTVTTLGDVVTKLNSQLTGAGASLDGIGIVVTSSTTGASSTLTFASAHTSGTDVSAILGLSAGTGAVLTQGAAAGTLTAESKEDAVNAIRGETNAYGYMFIDQPTSVEAKALAELAQAGGFLMYDVFSDADNLEIDPTNVVWDIKLSSLTNYRMMYSKANNRKMGTSYMARAHVVNFNGENTALTMHLKELSVAAESYTEGEITKAKNVGLDIYTTIKNTPCILTSGANDFMDNRYNLIGFQDALQTDLYNLLKQTGTKIPQTNRGMNLIIDQCEKTSKGFARAGVFGAGVWSSPDSFGDINVFKRAIEQNGYYWIYGALADQSQADREARKSTVIQGAVKMAGAVHSIDVIVNVNF